MTTLPLRTVYQGDTVNIDFTLQEPNGSFTDLSTADTIIWSLSDPSDIDTALLEKSIGSGISIISAPDGVLRVTIAAGQFDTPGTFVQELEATFGSATYTYGQGMLIVKAAVNPS